MAWEPYLERIGQAIEHPPAGPRLRPLATLGGQVTELLGYQAAHDAARFRAEIDGIGQRAEQQRLLLEQARDESEREATELRNDLRKAEAERDAIRHTVTWRLRDRLVSIRAVQRWRAR
jgi:hypothetical protein